MPNCLHPSVTIEIEFVDHVRCVSFGELQPPVVRVDHRQHGPISRRDGYWSRAHIHCRCRDCGHDRWFISTDWRTFPAWFTRHWLALVEKGGLPAELHRHYRMFDAAPAAEGALLCPRA